MHEHFDAHVAMMHIERLSSMRRLPGSPGEGLARAYIRGVCGSMGLRLREEEFRYSDVAFLLVLPLICLLLGLCCLAGSFLYLWGSSMALIPGALLLMGIYGGFRWSGAFERFGARTGPRRSSNLIGEIDGVRSRGTIMLSAHYDSKSQVMPVVLRAALFMLGFAGALLLGALLVMLGALALAGKDLLGNRVVFYASLFPAACLLALVFNFTGNRSPGALDNALGEAVILEVARVLSRRPLENFDVLIASFGCEEVGLIGSVKYLMEHESELKEKPFYMLNFDIACSPSGKIYLNTGFEIPPRRTSRRLNGLARNAAEERGFDIKGIFLPVGAAADHMPWVKHGFEATGFVSAAACIHSSRDSLDKVDREALRRVGEVALAVLSELDRTEREPDDVEPPFVQGDPGAS